MCFIILEKDVISVFHASKKIDIMPLMRYCASLDIDSYIICYNMETTCNWFSAVVFIIEYQILCSSLTLYLKELDISKR